MPAVDCVSAATNASRRAILVTSSGTAFIRSMVGLLLREAGYY